MMVPLDIKNCAHFRQVCLNMALSDEGPADPDKVVEAATKYFAFLSLGLVPEPAPMIVQSRTPSGLPDDWIEPVPLPVGVLNVHMVEGLSVQALQELRRARLTDLDVLSAALKGHGVVPA